MNGDIRIMAKFKPIKRSPVETDNPIIRGIDSLIIASEGYLGKRVYICGNPNCGTLIIFHKDAKRPILCKQCGEEIDWEGEYVRRIKICPKCNEEYEVNANYCSFHSPKIALQEKEIEK
jgi:hypothetical protein